MITPQFRVLEMKEWFGDRFAQQHSLMMDQWGAETSRSFVNKNFKVYTFCWCDL